MSSELNKHSEDNILIIKGRFKSISMNLYGQFIIIFNNEKKFDSFNTVVSTFSDLYDLEPHTEWDKYEEAIVDQKWKGKFNNNMTASLTEHFKKFSQEMNSVSILFDNVYEYDYNSMDITLFDLINRIVHDKNLILETGIQEVTPSDFLQVKYSRSQVKEKTEEKKSAPETDYSLEEGAVILPVKPILAPVRGRPIYELRIGDKVMIKIQPNSDRSNYFIDLLDLRDDSHIKPIPAEVIDIKAGSGKNDPIEILTSIGPGLYGKFIEEEKQVKLKVYNPAIDGQITTKGIHAQGAQNLLNNSKSNLSKGTMIMLFLFILILILFIILILLSW